MNPKPEPVREDRFAVVLYGGISLAIYMNGIAQELLRMVRGSDPNLEDSDLDDVERVYRDLARSMETRFVIDVISGTSAGGINGVALAKALVSGSKNLDVLRQAWVEEADIGLLLNDRNAFARAEPDALLDGRRMYDVLLKTLSKLGDDAAKEGRDPLVEILELYVTATDLEGQVVPIQLADKEIDERVHKTVFHFRYDEGDPAAKHEPRGDFGPDYDAMLAFAARCTSSFPVAFAPMRFSDIPARAKPDRDRYARLFPGRTIDDDRQFADGGYLDNRPFSYATDAIAFLPRSLPGGRKLLFIDPFPEDLSEAKQTAGTADYDFLQNAKLGAMTLPRREAIRDDIRAITGVNRRLERLKALDDRWKKDLVKLGRPKAGKPEDLENKDLQDVVNDRSYGPQYALYHHLRVYGTTDTLSNLVATIGGYEAGSNPWEFLRQILRAWRTANYSVYRNGDAGKQTENAFLSTFDLDYRMRRLNYLRGRMQDIKEPSEAHRSLRTTIEDELAHFRRRARARTPEAVGLDDRSVVGGLTTRFEKIYEDFISKPTLDERFKVARGVYDDEAARKLIDGAMAAIGDNFDKAFDASGKRLSKALADPLLADLEQDYEDFHWHDVMTFPFLEGTAAEEYSAIEVFRVSPVDNPLNPSPEKLAGLAAGAFGGFLNRDWRKHDILWGRLDGAERIVTALLPGEQHKEQRKATIEALQTKIVADEFGGKDASERQLALVHARLRDADVGPEILEDLRRSVGAADAKPVDFARFEACYRTTQPIGPGGREIAAWGSRSAGILARMIDGLRAEGFLGFAGTRAAAGLRTGGVLSAQLARFSMPGTFGRSLAHHLLFIAIAAGLLLVALAVFTGASAGTGIVIVLAAILAWVALYAAERVFRGRLSLSVFAKSVLGVLVGATVGALALFGAEAVRGGEPTLLNGAKNVGALLWTELPSVLLAALAIVVAFAVVTWIAQDWAVTQRRARAILSVGIVLLALVGAWSLWERTTGSPGVGQQAEAAAVR